MLPTKKDRHFILRNNDKQYSKKTSMQPKTISNNEENYNGNRSPPNGFNRSNSSFKRPELIQNMPDYGFLKNYKLQEDKISNKILEKDYNKIIEKDHNKISDKDYNKIMNKYPETIINATSLPEISEKDIINSKPYQELKTNFKEEKEKSNKLKKLLHDKENELQILKQDRLQLYNKIAMMQEQLKNYEVALEERKNNVEVSIPDFQSILLALRYSGGMNIRTRTPARDELNPDNMTYEELMHLEEQMGSVNRGFTEEQLAKLNSFIFNSKFNPNCNNQDSCTVCFSEFTVGNRLNKLSCGHVYHNNCIRPWLLKEKTCPVCKAIVTL